MRSPAESEREIELDPRASRMALLQKIVEAAIRSRYMAPRALRRGRRPGRGASGCLSLLLGTVVLLLALASGAFLFGRTVLLGY